MWYVCHFPSIFALRPSSHAETLSSSPGWLSVWSKVWSCYVRYTCYFPLTVCTVCSSLSFFVRKKHVAGRGLSFRLIPRSQSGFDYIQGTELFLLGMHAFPTHVCVSIFIFRVFRLMFQVSSHAETFSQDLGWPPFSSRYEIMYALHAISHSPSSIIFSLSLLSLVYRPQPDLYRVSGTKLLTWNMHAISHSPLHIGF